MGDGIQAMLGKLEDSPGDHALRARAAEALDAAGRRDEAIALLAPFVNITGHDDDAGLPCLCKACLAAAPATAEASGMSFLRSFAVARDRVLHFWMLTELESKRGHVRTSVASALAQRLQKRVVR